MPSAHWLIVLNVAGATMIASGSSDRGSPGLPYWLRTGPPDSAPSDSTSRNGSADGVTMSCTVQPRETASRTSVRAEDAGAAPQTTTDRTCDREPADSSPTGWLIGFASWPA